MNTRQITKPENKTKDKPVRKTFQGILDSLGDKRLSELTSLQAQHKMAMGKEDPQIARTIELIVTNRESTIAKLKAMNAKFDRIMSLPDDQFKIKSCNSRIDLEKELPAKITSDLGLFELARGRQLTESAYFSSILTFRREGQDEIQEVLPAAQCRMEKISSGSSAWNRRTYEGILAAANQSYSNRLIDLTALQNMHVRVTGAENQEISKSLSDLKIRHEKKVATLKGKNEFFKALMSLSDSQLSAINSDERVSFDSLNVLPEEAKVKAISLGLDPSEWTKPLPVWLKEKVENRSLDKWTYFKAIFGDLWEESKPKEEPRAMIKLPLKKPSMPFWSGLADFVRNSYDAISDALSRRSLGPVDRLGYFFAGVGGIVAGCTGIVLATPLALVGYGVVYSHYRYVKNKDDETGYRPLRFNLARR